MIIEHDSVSFGFDLDRYYFLKEEKRKREEEEARRRKEEEEAARRAKEAEEAARRAKEVEEAARRLKEEEETARKAREEEEAARRQKEQEEREAQIALEAEQQEKTTPLQQPTVPTSGKQPGDEKTLVLEHNKAPVDVEIEGKGRAHVDDVSVPKKQNQNSEKIPQVEAGPPLEVKEQQKQTEKESSALPRDERTQGKPMSPETQSGQSQNRAPPLSKLPVSRSQEKRELRRQRGLEHSQRESERAASAWKDDTSFKSKTLESPGKAEGKLKERSDSKELDQYTFVAWKGDKSKKDAKDVPTELVRPSTLPLDIPTSGPGRNGFSDPAIAAQPALAKEEANRRKEPSRSNTQPENLMSGPRSLEERNIKSLQYGFLCCSTFIPFFISSESNNIFSCGFPNFTRNRGISMSLDDVSKISPGGSSQVTFTWFSWLIQW